MRRGSREAAEPRSALVAALAALHRAPPLTLLSPLPPLPCLRPPHARSALTEGRIKGAALDVFTTEPLPAASPLWDLARRSSSSSSPGAGARGAVLLSPHCADRTSGFQFDAVRRFLGEAGRYAGGEPLENVVDKRAGY